MRPLLVAGASALAAGVTVGAWGIAEAHAFALRRVDVAVLPAGAAPIRVLHVSDLHLTPRQRDKVRWVRGLAAHRPDVVVVTGDNLGHADAVAGVARAFEPFAGVPGLFVFGSNDYYGPRRLNPFQYFRGPSRLHPERQPLPTDRLRACFAELGWTELTNARADLEVAGVRVTVVGLDDPHLGLDRMPPAGGPQGDLHLGLVHAPYARALHALADDGAALILAGHTHGGQVCLPWYGALVTNCDLRRGAASGLSRVDGRDAWLHVSAGLGTNPYAPLRVACRPEATLLTLTARP